MTLLRAALSSVVLLGAALPAESLTVRSAPLQVEVTLDPWGLTFVDDARGVVLQEGDAQASGSWGSLGFRTAGGWTHATRAISHRRRGDAMTLVLETTDAAGRRMIVDVAPERPGVVGVEARLEDGPEPDVAALGIGWSLAADEHLFGFGERSNAVAQRGVVLENWSAEGPFQPDERQFVPALVPAPGARTRDDTTYFPMPWVVSTGGYGLLVDNSETTYFRLGSDVPDRWSIELVGLPEGMEPRPAPARLRFRVFAGPTPADVLARFTAGVGRQPEPAAPWVLGPWFQASGSLDERVAQVRRLRDADAPVSVVQTYTHYLPCGSHANQRERERELTSVLHALGVAVTTYFNPMICTDYAAFDAAARAGALMRTGDGDPHVYDYTASRIFRVGQFDFSTRAGRRFYHRLLREAVADGYDGWMEDFGEYTFPDAFTRDGRDGSVTHNLYPVDYHCAAWDFARRQKRPIVRFQRSGWTGVAPCAQVVWNGDPSTVWDFDGLASAVKNGLNMGLSGIGIWGSDIGGFHAFFERALTDELLIRWVQLGAVSGVMRTQRDGVAIPAKVRPQVEDDDQIANWRRYTKLRTQLFPYVQAAVREYRRTGMPLMRHLILESPDDPAVVGVPHDFLFGPDLLAAPVVEPGSVSREVYLPRGTWIDFWRTVSYDSVSGAFVLGGPTTHLGPRSVHVPAPLAELPLLVRAGALIAMLPPDVDTLADYGDADAELVHLRDRLGTRHLLAFPRGASERRFGRRGRFTSVERTGVWELEIRGDGAEIFDVQASLATLESPFVPCAVRWRGRPMGAGDWSYEAATGVLRTRLIGRRGRLEVTGCAAAAGSQAAHRTR
jgi:alpha-glucosidase (family GH31 glycosyl hydrolase)